jgi:hypothetical protein
MCRIVGIGRSRATINGKLVVLALSQLITSRRKKECLPRKSATSVIHKFHARLSILTFGNLISGLTSYVQCSSR